MSAHKQHNKPVIAIAALMILAAVGGTFAYFRFTESFDNNFRLGVQEITYTETFESPTDWVPCTETPKALVITNTSTTAINARIKIREKWEKLDENGEIIEGESLPLEVEGRKMAVINFVNTSSWVRNDTDGYYYYQGDIAAGGGVTNSFIESVTFNCDAKSEYSSARYHLYLDVETIEANADARRSKGWNY